MRKKNQRNTTIGILVDYFVEFYQKRILDSLTKSLTDLGCDSICFTGSELESSKPHHKARNTAYDLVTPDAIDGLVVLSATIGMHVGGDVMHAFLERFHAIPLVSIGISFEGIPSITVDNAAGITGIVGHLVCDHGLTRLAFLRGTEGNPEAEARFSAYRNAIIAHGLTYDEDLVAQGDFYYGSGEIAVQTLLDKRKTPFDALIAANDIMAIDTINALSRRKIDVPARIAVTGFDDIEEASSVNPSLTTVAQPLAKIGWTAARIITKLVAGERVLFQTILPPEIIRRDSCGCFRYTHRDLSFPGIKKPAVSTSFGKTGKRSSPAGDETSHLPQQPDSNRLLDGGRHKELFLRLKQCIDDLSFTGYRQALDRLALEYSRDADRLLDLQFLTLELFDRAKKRTKSTRRREEIKRLFRFSTEVLWKRENRLVTRARLLMEDKLRALHVISIDLAATFDLEKLCSVIEERIPSLGFSACFIFLYPDETHIQTAGRIIFIDPGDKSRAIIDTRSRIPSTGFLAYIRKIIPHIPPLCLIPLQFESAHVGFLVTDLGTNDGIVHETLSVQLGGALRGVMLMERVQKYSGELERQVRLRTIKLEKARDELERINRQLTQLDGMKNDFIANITHDFRSPLTAILNSADLAIKYPPTRQQEHERNYSVIFESSRKLKRTIDCLLELARMDAQGVKLRIKQIVLSDFLDSIIDYYTSSALGSSIRIHKDYTADPGLLVHTDPEKLEEVFNNVISNALKFVDPAIGVISVSVKIFKNSVRIRVSDNGIGINPDKLEIIFNRFEQAHEGRNSRYQGTGIGLAFARQIMDYLKGRIWAKSAGPGKGADFYIQIPRGQRWYGNAPLADSQEEPGGTPATARRPESGRNNKAASILTHFGACNAESEFDHKKAVILVIDDDEFVREIVIKYLKNFQYENFIEAPDGKLGLQAVYEHRVDLVICDYNMPGLRGDEIHDRLLENPAHKTIPIIFLSAVADNKLIVDRRLKGAYAFLKKPIDEKELTVEQILVKHFELLKTLQLATIDALTNLNNRRKVLEDLSRELAMRRYRNLAVVFADLDHFKRINDRFGHAAGDRVLASTAALMRASLREYDIIGRFGGEEFIMILPDSDQDQALLTAQMMQKKIRENKIPLTGQIITITASFGVASLIDHEQHVAAALGIPGLRSLYEVTDPRSTDWQQIDGLKHRIGELLLSMADSALYRAKRSSCPVCPYSGENDVPGETCPRCKQAALLPGRDRVVVFRPD